MITERNSTNGIENGKSKSKKNAADVNRRNVCEFNRHFSLRFFLTDIVSFRSSATIFIHNIKICCSRSRGCREWVSKMKKNNMLCSIVSCNRKQAFSEAKHCSSECLWICDFLQCEFYLAASTLHIGVQSKWVGDPGTGTCTWNGVCPFAVNSAPFPFGSDRLDLSANRAFLDLHSAEQFHQTTGPLSPAILDGIIEWGLNEREKEQNIQ